jgi:hypothetical protein
MMSGGAGRGMSGQGFDPNGKRTERAIEYIPIEDLDKAMASGKSPAMTVIPLRGVILYMEVPYKKQIEEIKRALRLPTNAEALTWGPIYDGYEVQRRVTELNAEGQPETSDWTDYKFEDVYQQRINSRKVKDAIEDGGYSAYFLRYDMELVLPLPELVSELGTYPAINLPNINATIKKLKEAQRPAVKASETLDRLTSRTPRRELYNPTGGDDTSAIYGGDMGKKPNPGSPTVASSSSGPSGNYRPGMMDSSNSNVTAPVEIEQLLLRFVDVDVEPEKTYEYRIRLRMLNPNFQRTSEVANPAYAKEEVLKGPWTGIDRSVTIPPERFLYAADVAAYKKSIEETYSAANAKERDLRDRLQVKDNQVVVEICEWMEEVKTVSGKREPVGAWVVADIPVSRGEYIGRKHYVKLPLWSSETRSYVLREITATAGKIGPKDLNQPKGWMVDFFPKNQDILVDFDGGRVLTKQGSKTVADDAATELLVLSRDGKLTVKKSVVDEANIDRKQITSTWTKWVSEVEKKKVGGDMGDNFAPKPGGIP